MTNPKLIALYQRMADHTAPECASACTHPHSCCDKMYCDMAIEIAASRGEPLTPTGHPTLPLMGTSGCVAAPHLRPLCTLHTCAIGSIGFKRGDPGWTRRYFALREKIEEMEMESWR